MHDAPMSTRVSRADAHRRILAAAERLLRERGPFLLAVQAASFHDPTIEATFGELTARFDVFMTGQMQAAMDEGRVAPGNASELARAMNRFNNAYLLDAFGRERGVDRETAM